MTDLETKLADLNRGAESIIVDAFRATKEYFGGRKLDTKNPFVRKVFRGYVAHNRHYICKDQNGARYNIVSPDVMFKFLKRI